MARKKQVDEGQVEMEILPPGLDPQDWADFVENRRLIGKPMTQIARRRMLQKITRLLAQGVDVRHEIERALIGGWQDLHPEAPKQAGPGAPQFQQPRITRQMIEQAARPGETEEDVVRRLKAAQARENGWDQWVRH